MSQASFLSELQRRNVVRMAGLYLVVAWLITQVTATLLPGFEAPAWVFRVIVMLLAIGFVPALVFSWVFELTPEGLKRESEIEPHESITHETARRMNRMIIAGFVLVLVVFALDRFMLAPKREARAVTKALDEARPAPGAQAQAKSQAQSEKSATPVKDAIPAIESDPSIAVLPFVNMSSDKEQEYFSDGISEELLNLLAKVPKLRVIARTSSFAFKGQNLEVPEIARRLHVASVLEGSVRKSGETVRITVQLIRAQDGSHLWSETYDRTLKDIFEVQDEIAAAVVSQLKVKLLGAAPAATPGDPKAYPLILQARALAENASAAGRVQSIELNKRALAIAPHEARAWAGLARGYASQVVFGERPAAEGARLAKEAANKALELDPGNAAAYAVLARVAAEFEFDLPAAARYFERGLATEPGNLYLLNNASILLATLGRLEESQRLVEYRVAQDPASATTFNNLGILMMASKRWDEALEALRTALSLSPDLSQTHFAIGTTLLVGKHDAKGALAEFDAEPDETTRLAGRSMALHALGRSAEADAALAELIAKYAQEQPAYIAFVHAFRGQPDAAFEWLDKAAALNDPGVSTVLMEPLVDPLHEDPRWLPFLNRVGYAPEQVAKVKLDVKPPQ